MRLIYLATSALPAVGRAVSIEVAHMCDAFARAGHEVVLVAPERPGRLKNVGLHEYYGVSSAFRVEYLPWPRWKGRGYVYGWMAARRARELQADLVYGRSIVGCYFAARAGLPVMLERHEPVSRREPLLRWLFSALVRHPRLKRVVVVSHSLADWLAISGAVPRGLLFVAPNASADDGPAAEAMPLDRSQLHAGYIGSLRPGKGMELIARLAPLTPWVTYHVVGGSAAEVGGWNTAVPEASNLVFHGHVPRPETGRYRRSCDVLLAPYSRAESRPEMTSPHVPSLGPLKLIEYMAAAKPILCSDLPAYREILSDERTALLCDPEDVHSWVQALERLRRDEALRARLGQAARAQFLANHTWERRARAVLEGIA